MIIISFIFRMIGIFLLNSFLLVIPHELAHYAVAKFSGYKIFEVNILFLCIKDKKVSFNFNLDYGLGSVGAIPTDDYKNYILYTLSGCIVNILSGCLLIAFSSNILQIIGGSLLCGGIINLCPFDTTSDGNKAYLYIKKNTREYEICIKEIQRKLFEGSWNVASILKLKESSIPLYYYIGLTYYMLMLDLTKNEYYLNQLNSIPITKSQKKYYALIKN